MTQCMHKGDQPVGEERDGRRIGRQADRLAHERAGIVEQRSPEVACFRVARIARIVTKPQKDRDRQPDQRERNEIQRHLPQKQPAVQVGDDRGEYGCHDQLRQDFSKDRATHHKQHA